MSQLGTDTMKMAKLNAILNRAGFDDAEIARGIRLKTSGIQKLANSLGVSTSDASSMLGQLVQKLKDENRRMAENYTSVMEGARYGMERDRMGNVTVRDSHTGNEVFLRGSAATNLVNAVKGGDEQGILAAALNESLNEDVIEEESYEEEIRQDRGSYNFPWAYNREQGTGTAEYSGRGDTFKVHLVSVRDADGDEIDFDDAMKADLTSQAFKFIGQV